jgi:hypothetical protein
VLDDHRRILFLGVGQDLEQRRQCGSGLNLAYHLVSDRCVWVHLIEFLVRTFGLSKSGGFIHLALENKAKGGSSLDKAFPYGLILANLSRATTIAGPRGMRLRAGR